MNKAMAEHVAEGLAERFALEHVLSEFPDDVDFEDILERIEEEDWRYDEDDEIVVWSVFEYRNVVEEICDLAASAKTLLLGFYDSITDSSEPVTK